VDEDLRLMKEVGLNLVRVGEFAWSSLEPEEGRYELDWLRRVLDGCREAEIGVILCTPTPTPPRWLTLAYPEVLRVDRDGKPFEHGSRQHVSHTSPTYRGFSRKITEVLARTFGHHPALVAWQTDNEFLCHVEGDYGESATKAWHDWLREKYGAVERLNACWSTRIWSEDYPSFEAVPPPRKTPFMNTPGVADGRHHTSLAAAWWHFTSDTVVAFQGEQLEIIRQHSDAPITHNHIAQTRLSAEDLFGDLDFATTDIYLAHDDIWRSFATLDWMRCVKPGVPYGIMETSPSHNGAYFPWHKTHPKGFLANEALLFLGMGGNMVSYWLWRQQRSGSEMAHGSVITAWGTPSVNWQEVRAVSDVMEKAAPLLLETPPARAEIALHQSKHAQAHLQAEELWETYTPDTPLEEVYRPLLEGGFWRDVIFEGADVTGYKVVLSPLIPALPNDLVARMTRFVEGGGTWIVGPMSGCRTVHGTVPTEAGLGALDALAGVKTLYPVGIHSCRGSFGDTELELGWYCFALEAAHEEAEVLGRYLDGPAAGTAWCVSRRLGRGRVVLLAAHALGRYGEVVEHLTQGLELPRYRASWGSTLIPREGSYLAVNWDGRGGTVTLPEGGTDLLTGARLEVGERTLAPFERLAVRAG